MAMKRLCLGGVLLLLGVGGWTAVQGQVGVIGPAGPCEHDCFEIEYMEGYSGGDYYCWEFVEWYTGRIVWAPPALYPAMGGVPVAFPNCQQDLQKWAFCNPLCPSDAYPRAAESGVFATVTAGFGCYHCSG